MADEVGGHGDSQLDRQLCGPLGRRQGAVIVEQHPAQSEMLGGVAHQHPPLGPYEELAGGCLRAAGLAMRGHGDPVAFGAGLSRGVRGAGPAGCGRQ